MALEGDCFQITSAIRDGLADNYLSYGALVFFLFVITLVIFMQFIVPLCGGRAINSFTL